MMGDATYRTFETHVVKATSSSTSLRTTVPQTVATALQLREGDVLVWKYAKDGHIMVEKLSP